MFSAFLVGFHKPGVPSHICQTDPRSRSKMDADSDVGAKVESSYDPVENGHRSFLVTQERGRGSHVKMPWRGSGERVVVIGHGPSWPGLRTRVHSGGDGLEGPVSTSEHSRFSALHQRRCRAGTGVFHGMRCSSPRKPARGPLKSGIAICILFCIIKATSESWMTDGPGTFRTQGSVWHFSLDPCCLLRPCTGL